MPFWEILLLGIDSAFIYKFYYEYKQKNSFADLLEKTKTFEVGEELIQNLAKSNNRSLPYAGVTGITKALKEPLNIKNSTALIHHTDVLQHRSIRFSSGWQDITTNIGSTLNSCNFGIVSSKLSDKILKVSEPLKSPYLLNNLPIFKQIFEPCEHDLLSRSLDVLSGNIIKGHSFTEKILEENVPILAIGTISIDKTFNNLLLTPPENYPFVLTTLSKNDLIHTIRNEAKIIKYFYYGFSIIGVVASCYFLYRFFKRKQYSDINIQITQPPNSQCSSGIDSCVVCLSNSRKILTLPCRHFATCKQCFSLLPSPKKCPACRNEIRSFYDVYVP